MAMLLTENKNWKDLLDDKKWIGEFKRDGNRLFIKYVNGQYQFFNRKQELYTKDIPKEIIASMDKFKDDNYATEFLIDGELVYVDKDGADHRTQAQCPEAVPYFMAFDILSLNHENLRERTWVERKHELTQLFFIMDMQPSMGEHVILVPHFVETKKLYDVAEKMDMEGIVLKHVDGKYIHGRSKECIKVKFTKTDEYIVIGYALASETSINTKGETIDNKRFPTFGALMLAKYDSEDKLISMGRVGGGFKDIDLEKVTPLLHKEDDDNANLTGLVDKDYRYAKGTIKWMNPLHYFVIEVKMACLTEYGKPFQPRFLSLRDDKKPKDCIK